MSRDRGASDEMQAFMEARWPTFAENSLEHVEAIEAVVAPNAVQQIGACVAARTAAHKLRGGLAMYGRPEGSDIAGIIEEALSCEPVDTSAIPELVERLREIITD